MQAIGLGIEIGDGGDARSTRRDRDAEQVGPLAAGGDVPGAKKQGVAARAAHQDVRRVVGGIVGGAAEQRVVAEAAGQQIIAIKAIDAVIAAKPAQHVVGEGPPDQIVTGATVIRHDRVRAVVHAIVAPTRKLPIRTAPRISRMSKRSAFVSRSS